MNVRFFTFLAVVVCAVSAPLSANAFDPRLWVDDSTTFSVEGTIDPERSFADVSSSVFIVDSKGRTYECKLNRLYETAREYVELARNAYKSNDPKLMDNLDWMLDSARDAGVRRVVTVDGVDYAFRWVRPGKYSEPTTEFDPNLARAVAATRSESRSKKAAAQKNVKTGFWMLETEVTIQPVRNGHKVQARPVRQPYGVRQIQEQQDRLFLHAAEACRAQTRRRIHMEEPRVPPDEKESRHARNESRRQRVLRVAYYKDWQERLAPDDGAMVSRRAARASLPRLSYAL